MDIVLIIISSHYPPLLLPRPWKLVIFYYLLMCVGSDGLIYFWCTLFPQRASSNVVIGRVEITLQSETQETEEERIFLKSVNLAHHCLRALFNQYTMVGYFSPKGS